MRAPLQLYRVTSCVDEFADCPVAQIVFGVVDVFERALQDEQSILDQLEFFARDDQLVFVETEFAGAAALFVFTLATGVSTEPPGPTRSRDHFERPPAPRALLLRVVRGSGFRHSDEIYPAATSRARIPTSLLRIVSPRNRRRGSRFPCRRRPSLPFGCRARRRRRSSSDRSCERRRPRPVLRRGSS